MPAVKGKHTKKKKGGSVRKKKGRKPLYMLPDWLHWVITGALIIVISLGAYYLFLRPYFYRMLPCQGAREYGVCLPSGFLCYGIDVSHHQGRIDWDTRTPRREVRREKIVIIVWECLSKGKITRERI